MSSTDIVSLQTDNATLQTAFAIVAGSVAFLVSLVAILFMYFRERWLTSELKKQDEVLKSLKEEVMEKYIQRNTVETFEQFLKKYKKPLLQAAFDLQSRIYQMVEYNMIYSFYQKNNAREREYAMKSTMYFFSEFFAWLELVRQSVVFLTGSETAENLNYLIDSIKFQFTGGTASQGVKVEKNADIMQLYIVDLRAIGNAMLRTMGSGDNLRLLSPIMTVDDFYKLVQSNEEGTGPEESKHFAKIIGPLKGHVERLAQLDSTEAPKQRLAIIQVLLCKMIAILDDAVPWDLGPRFNVEEPRYIQRDFRLFPLVAKLSKAQKDYLRNLPFFANDQNLSFPGFREDMAGSTQAERDQKLWFGACPPIDKSKRSEEWKIKNEHFHQGAGQGPRRKAVEQMVGAVPAPKSKKKEEGKKAAAIAGNAVSPAPNSNFIRSGSKILNQDPLPPSFIPDNPKSKELKF